MRVQRIRVLGLVVVAIMLLVSACGNSSSSDPVATTAISGSVFAAPVAGGAVVIKNAGGTVIAGPVNTASDGTYTVSVPTSAMSADMRIESSGGTFVDEATGLTTTAGAFGAYVSAGSATTGVVNIDPSTTIVHHLVTTGSRTIGEAQTLFNTAFGYTPDPSVACRNTPSTGATTAQRLAAFRAAAFSQLTKDSGLTPDKQADLLTAIASDLADDGKLNGSTGSVSGTNIPQDIQNKFEQAVISYLSNTTANLTGLTSGDIGDLAFAKVVLSTTYRVEYVPGTMSPAVGKTKFQVKITKRSDQTPATGLAVSLMPMMHMPTMSHTAPVDAVTEDPANPGTYNCTVYFLMASGPTMGFWDVKVMIGSGMMGESATFHPCVGMAMGTDTVRVTLNGTTDMATSMTSTMGSKRSYYLFNDGLISGMTFTFNIFIATMEDMMHMPAVSGGTILTSPTGTWAVDPATSSLKASLDNTFPAASTVTAIDNGTGHWSLPGLSLSSSMTSTIYVKFTVNSEVKTAGTGSTSPGYGTFAVKPIAAGM